MAIYKTGTLVVPTPAAVINLNLGFIPSHIRVINQTLLAASADRFFSAEWFDTMANGTSLLIKNPAVPVFSYGAANGFTPFQTGNAALWTATNLTITNISQAATALVTCANSLNVGDVVTFSGVVGMVQINTLRGVVTAATGANFNVNINTTGFTAYGSGGIANVIASSNAAYCATPVNGGPTQANVGQIGLTLGSDITTTAADVLYYEATLNAPFTS